MQTIPRSLRRTAAIFLALSLFFSLVSCGGAGREILESSKTEQTPLMTVGDFDVPLEIYRYVALNYKADFENGKSSAVWEGDEGAKLLERLTQRTNETIVRLYTTPAVCEKYGIGIDDAYVKDAVEAQMNAIYEDFENDYKAYDEYIRSANMTDSVYRFLIRNDVLAEELLAEMERRGEIATDDAEIRKILMGDGAVRVLQILVPADNGKTDAENEARAAELREMAESGEDFYELVQSYGGDLTMFNNPDGYYVTRGTYHAAFEEAAFALGVGEISGVVRTDAGWSILKCLEKEQSYIDRHFDTLAERYIRGQYDARLEEYAASLSAQPAEALAQYTIFNLEATY
ncbi:MAG: peptidylprolyl isomerase [Clostridia bacterium]|nr:peptidylprolyl isomerase [Clostridia bacterium]